MTCQSSTTAYPSDMDPECVPICDALNALRGIVTCESCCGHGRIPFRVFFTAETLDSLAPLVEATSCGTPFFVEARWANGGGTIYFMLQGPTDEAGAWNWLTEALL